MPRTSGGVYTAPSNTAAISGQPIGSAAFNSLESDIGNELTNSLDRLGRGGMQAALSMGGFQINGLADPVLNQDAATKNFVINTPNLFTNASLAQMAASTIKGNTTGGTANASDIPLATLQSLLIPPGLIYLYGGVTPPNTWIECAGQAISRTVYAPLFGAISTSYGAGDGSTTFNLPDFRGYFPRGWDHGAGVDPGRALGGAVQQDQFQDHVHNVGLALVASGPAAGVNAPVNWVSGGAATSGPQSGNHGTETRPKNLSVMFIIKT